MVEMRTVDDVDEVPNDIAEEKDGSCDRTEDVDIDSSVGMADEILSVEALAESITVRQIIEETSIESEEPVTEDENGEIL